MKEVFINAMVAHVWAQRSQSRGRSIKGNFSFEGETLYSYRTAIGRFIVDDDNHIRATLVTSNTYSMTTSGKHMPALRRAIDYGRGDFAPCFRVPNVRPIGKGEHESNLSYLVSRYTDDIAKLRRARYVRDWGNIAVRLDVLAETARQYARTFDLEVPAFDARMDARAILEHHEKLRLKRETPAYLRKQAAAKVAREAKKAREEALARANAAERLEAWRKGELSNLGYRNPRTDENGGAFLRVRGQVLETSLGATVPLDHAIKVYRAVKRCRERGEGWSRNGETIRVGLFQLDAIEPNGDFKAGCHRINWPEIERAAIAAGVA